MELHMYNLRIDQVMSLYDKQGMLHTGMYNLRIEQVMSFYDKQVVLYWHTFTVKYIDVNSVQRYPSGYRS